MSLLWESSEPIKIFYCYAHEDDIWRETLEKHLRILKRQGYIVSWHGRMISAGKEWDREIDTHLKTAQIILSLISPDFMDSDYCFDREMQQALLRHQSGDAVVIPIIIRPVYWKEAPFSKLQVLPKNGRPVTKWSDRDEAFENITQGIVEVIKELLAQPTRSTQESQPAHEQGSGFRASAPQEGKRQWFFTGQRAHEQVRLVARRHLVLLGLSTLPLFFGSLFVLVATTVAFFVLHVLGAIAFLFSGGIMVASIVVVARNMIAWWFEFYIVTDERIIYARGLFRHTRLEIPLENIQQIGIDISLLVASKREYGNVYLYLNGSTFIMKGIPTPRRVRDIIKALCFGDKQKTKRIQE